MNKYRDQHRAGLAVTRRNRRPLARVIGQFIVAGGLALLVSGCAVHYGNSRSGIEYAWGVGQVTWQVAPSTNGSASVSGGTRQPGLVLGVGPDFFGVALGYQVRERLQIVSVNGLEKPRARINGHDLPANTGRRWFVGQASLRTPAKANIAVVSGQAGAGIGLGFERGRPNVDVGWQSRQLTTVSGADVFVELTTPGRRWPYFDFPSTEVAVMAATNLTLRSTEP